MVLHVSHPELERGQEVKSGNSRKAFNSLDQINVGLLLKATRNTGCFNWINISTRICAFHCHHFPLCILTPSARWKLINYLFQERASPPSPSGGLFGEPFLHFPPQIVTDAQIKLIGKYGDPVLWLMLLLLSGWKERQLEWGSLLCCCQGALFLSLQGPYPSIPPTTLVSVSRAQPGDSFHPP